MRSVLGNRLVSALAASPLLFSVLFCLGFVALPLLTMGWETVATDQGLSLRAYGSILEDPVDRTQLWMSLVLGLVSMLVAGLLGCSHAFLTYRTNLPMAGILGPLGVAPLILPPILMAMSFSDLLDASGFWACAFLLGLAYTPFVAVLCNSGLRRIDGPLYDAAWLARGRLSAEFLLFRMVLPEILAGCLLAFIFAISEHGVPEFLTVRGKTWHTYAEGIFARWSRRATGLSHEDMVSPLVAALPLLLIIAVAIIVALRLRGRASNRGDIQALPIRRMGGLRWLAMLLPLAYLGMGLLLPVLVMARWAAGSTQVLQPMSLTIFQQSMQTAVAETGGDLLYTIGIGLASALLTLMVAIPLARLAARRLPFLDHLCVLPIAIPAILLGIGMVHVFNNRALLQLYALVGDFYDSWGLLVCGYAARFLPFAVLTLSQAGRRFSPSLEDAAVLSGRSRLARTMRIHLPLLFPAIASATCLIFILALRELDMAVILPAGNNTVVRRLSNIVHFGGEDAGGALALLLLLAALALPTFYIILGGRRLKSLS